ncbi:MAG: toxin TcdB middle/N-terminal domain-containing protein [Armatimonadota bacterium]
MREGPSQASTPLPSGGGSQESVGQNFEVDLATGTGSYRVPFAFPPGPRQTKPELSLGYSTGYGNGIVGLGWSLSLSAVTRSHAEGQPAFDDAVDSFTYGGQRLVLTAGGHFRQEVEKDFYRIERDGDGWRVQTTDGSLLRYGITVEARVELPVARPDPVYQWLLESSEDALGNRIGYAYAHDGGHARLSQIRYGPYIIRLDHELRPDPIVSHRLGLERVLRHRLREVRLILVRDGMEEPIKAYRLAYEQAPHSGASRLTSVALVAFDTSTAPSGEDALPPVRFQYSDVRPEEATLQPLSSRSGVLPPSLTQANLSLIDVDGIGLPGFLHVSDTGGHYWPNLGGLEVGSPRRLRHFPTALADQPDRLRVASLSGHGLLDLIVMTGRAGGYYALQPGGEWETFRPFRKAPAVSLLDARTRLVDLDFDGRADLLSTDLRAFYAVRNRGEGDFEAPRVTARVRDRGQFPDVDLADPHVHLADMTGDGGAAIVEVRNRAVTYWPNLGHGRFGPAVTMTSPPVLPENYEPARVFLTDVDGDGLADLVYVDLDRVQCSFNRSGRAFAPPVTIERTPLSTSTSVLLVDLMGHGSQGLLWSGAGPLSARGTHYFLDLAGPNKANLLTRISTPEGAVMAILYGTSVTEAVRDRGTPDAAYLPFPVQVVRQLAYEDLNTGAVAVSQFSYHQGYYDRRRKRFLGFGRVERRDVGDGEVPDRITATHFHTRPPERATRGALQRHWVLARMPYRTEVLGADDGGLTPFWVETIEGEAVLVETGVDGSPIYFAARRRLRRVTTDRGVRALEREVRYEYGPFGNVTLEEETRRFRDGAGVERSVARSTETRYAEDSAAYLVGLPVMTVERDGGTVMAASRLYYDGPPFQGLPLGQAVRGVLSRREALAFTDDLVAQVYGANLPEMAALGYIRVNDPDLGPGWWIVEVAQRTDAVGNPEARRDPLGNETTIEFDAHGIYPTRVINALGQTIEAEYDHRYGQMIRQVARDGGESRWIYDLHGRLTQIFGPQDVDGAPSTVYERGSFDSPPRMTILRRATAGAAALETQHLYFDARGQRLQSRLEITPGQVAVSETPISFARGLATVEQTRYFAASPSYSTTDAPTGTRVSRTRRDALDRPVEFEALDNSTAGRRYEAGVIHHYDAEDLNQLGSHFDTPRSEYFDSAGQLVSVVERLTPGAGQCTQYHRNAAGLLTGVTDHLGNVILTRRYDLLGRLVGLDHREAGLHRYVLDAAGNCIEERRGSERLYRAFDALDRITMLRLGAPDALPVETYAYDAGPGDRLIGRVARVDGDFGSVEYSYTRCGHLKAKTRTFPDRPGETFTLRYTYDRQSRPTLVTYPDGHVVHLGYDSAGRPSSVSGVIDAVEYDATGYLTRIAFANGVETTYTYHPQPGRIDEMRTALVGGDSYQHFGYNCDRVGNPVTIDDLATVAGHVRDNRRYVYDALYRLSEAEGRDAAGNYAHVYGYDSLGNLLDRPEVDGGLTLTYANTRVTGSSSGEVFAYDDGGNLISLGGWTHTYDPRDRVTESVRADGTRVITRYDYAGTLVSTRVERQDGSLERTWHCDDAYILNEDGSSETYVFFHRHRAAVLLSNGDGFVFHPDPLGSPTCFSRLANGSFAGQTIYYPYGGVALEMAFGAQSRFRYGNHAAIPGTGLVHFGVRAYSPRLGRFVQPDPIVVHRPEGALRLPRGLHPYAYAIDNPASLTDPYGASWFSDAIDWVGDRISDVGNAIVGAAEAVAGAIADAASAVGGFIAGVAGAIWDGIKAAGSAIWEAIKWAAGAVWEGIKWLGQALAFLGTWALTIADFAITWLNPLNWIALALDQVDHPITNVLSFIIKFARSPITTTVGLIIGGIGLLTGDVENVAFKNGLIVFEWDPSSNFSGTSFGGVVHLWGGDASNEAFEHETYHSYQYVGWGDAFIPAYVATGVWGLFSSALAGDPQWTCFGGVNDSYTFGQPLEMGGELIDKSANCA